MRKIIIKCLLVMSCLLLAGAGLSSGEDEKGNNSQYDKKELSVSEYTKRLKVKYLMGEIDESMSLIDEMFDKYGHNATGLYYRCLGISSYFEAVDGQNKKVKYLEQLFTCSDTLSNYCNDTTIQKSDRKDCEEFVNKIDSVKTKCRKEIYGK